MSSRQQQQRENQVQRIITNVDNLFNGITKCTKINTSSLDDDNKNKLFITFLNNSIKKELITLKDINYNLKNEITEILIDDLSSENKISIIYKNQGSRKPYIKSSYSNFIQDLYIIDDKTIYYIEKKLVTDDIKTSTIIFKNVIYNYITFEDYIDELFLLEIKHKNNSNDILLKIKHEDNNYKLIPKFIYNLNENISKNDSDTSSIKLINNNYLLNGYIIDIHINNQSRNKQIIFTYKNNKNSIIPIEEYNNFINNIYISEDKKKYFYYNKNINDKFTVYYKKLFMLEPKLENITPHELENAKIIENEINKFFKDKTEIYEQINIFNFDSNIEKIKQYIEELNKKIKNNQIVLTDVNNNVNGEIIEISYHYDNMPSTIENKKHKIHYIYKKQRPDKEYYVAELKVFIENIYIYGNKIFFLMPFKFRYDKTPNFKEIKIILKDIDSYLSKKSEIIPKSHIINQRKRSRTIDNLSHEDFGKLNQKISEKNHFTTDLLYINKTFNLDKKAELIDYLNELQKRKIQLNKKSYTDHYFNKLLKAWLELKKMKPPSSSLKKQIRLMSPAAATKRQRIMSVSQLSGGNNKITRKINIDSNNKLYIKYNDIIIYLKTK
jgi:hypothetical protein